MSFSGNVKEELVRNMAKARHCQIAEMAGILCFLGKIKSNEERIEIQLETENVTLAKRFYELAKKAFKVVPEVSIKRNSHLNRNRVYSVSIVEAGKDANIVQALKISKEDVETELTQWVVNDLLLQKSCCKRAYIRGAFLATGSITDPEKGYHFEVVCNDKRKTDQLIEQLGFFGLEAKCTPRKNHLVTYIKEGAQIVDVLNVMEAHNALMELENVRILKEVRNSVNRKVNCETANINKTVNAAIKQIEDIEYIKSHRGFEDLNPSLMEIAELRLQYPEAALKDLGAMLNPPVGKSGVNHRLKKLSEIARELKG